MSGGRGLWMPSLAVQEHGMAEKRTAAKAKTNEKGEAPEKEADTPDSPLLDMSDAGVRRMIKLAKKRGFVTYDELNAVLPSEEFTSEHIEDILAMLSEQGINVVDNDENAEEEEGQRTEEEADDEPEGELAEAQPARPLAKAEKSSEPAERTDDPVRMYLREMGSVELLSREGEIAIAKRIEAGREAMIAGLCESPLTFQAIIIWRDELNEGKVFLRDIIDLEATYAGPDGKAAPLPTEGGETPLAPSARPAGGGEDEDGGDAQPSESDFDEDDMENSMSLAAIEAELKPKVLETFDRVADAYKKLRRLQEQDIENRLKNESLSPAQERKYKKLKDELIADVKSLRLNQARIDALVAQLYDINRKLVGMEGRIVRLAESYGVDRVDFLKHYQGAELDSKWLMRVSKLTTRGWKNFIAKEKDGIKTIRQDIQTLAAETGLETAEFKKIVQMVQKGEREARQAKREMVEANLRLVI
jgi:RNA polymerase primary sigma factor